MILAAITRKIYTIVLISVACLTTEGIALGQASQNSKIKPGSANAVPPTSRQLTMMEQSGFLQQTAEQALNAGNYADAEAEARDALSIDRQALLAPRILAEALDAQGKSQEALKQYQMIADAGTEAPRELLPYALLLLNAGQWKQAVAAYDKAILHLPASFIAPQNAAGLKFNANDEQQTALTVAIYLGEGIDENSLGERRVKAYRDYEKALKLEPDSLLTNYYYGYGWQQLSPAERAKLAAKPGQREAVKAALEKAAALGTGDVQTQAKAELKQLR